MIYKSKYSNLSSEEIIKKYIFKLRCIAYFGILIMLIIGYFAIIDKISIRLECLGVLIIWCLIYVLKNINFMNLYHIMYTDCDPKKYIEVMNILEKRDKRKLAQSTLNLNKAYGYYYTNELDLMRECLCKINFKKQNMKVLLITINLWLNYSIKSKNEEIYNEYYNKLYNIIPKNKREESMIQEIKEIVKLNNYIEENNEKEARILVEQNEKNAKYLFMLVLNNFYKAQVNLMANNKEEAKKNLDFVIKNGNTMYKKVEAEELLKVIS